MPVDGDLSQRLFKMGSFAVTVPSARVSSPCPSGCGESSEAGEGEIVCEDEGPRWEVVEAAAHIDSTPPLRLKRKRKRKRKRRP